MFAFRPAPKTLSRRMSRKLSPVLGGLATSLVLLALCHLAFGQAQPATPPSPSPDAVSVEVLQDRIKAIDGAAELDETAKSQLRDTYQKALRELEEAARRQAAAAGFREKIETATSQKAQIASQMADVAAQEPAQPPDDATVQQLEQGLAEREAQAAQLTQELSTLEAEPKRRAARKKEIPTLLDEAKGRLAEIKTQLAASPSGESDTSLQARQALLLARQQNVEALIAALEQESAAYDATAELLPQQRDLTAARRTLAEAEVAVWQSRLNEVRRSAVQQQLAKAESEAAEVPPALAPLAEQIHELAKEAKRLAGQLETLARQEHQSEDALDDLEKRFRRTKDKEDVVGLTNAIGLLLRSERAELPNVDHYRRGIRFRQPKIRTTQLRWFELEDERSELASPDVAVQTAMREIARQSGRPIAEELEPAVQSLIETKRETLDNLIRDYDIYFNSLIELDNTEQRLVRLIDEYTQYIDERVLWIASAEPLSLDDLRESMDATSWLLNPAQWFRLGDCFHSDMLGHPLLWVLAMSTFGTLLLGRRRMKVRLLDLGETVQQSGSTQISLTIDAIILTVLTTVAWPGLLWFLGSRLSIDAELPDFARAVGAAMVRVAAVLLPLDLLKRLCRNKGVAEAHFDWPEGSLRVIVRNLHWLMLFGLPLVFVFAIFQQQASVQMDNSLGRLAYLAALLLVALFLHRVLRPSGAFFRYLEAEGRARWFCRFRHLWHGIGVVAPLAIVVFAALGYYYTARQLFDRFLATILLPIGLVVIGAFLARWVLVVRRRLAMDRMRSRVAAGSQQEAAGPEGVAIPTTAASVESGPDLKTISEQTRRLISGLLLVLGAAAIWLIWVDVFPALRILDQIPIWQTIAEVKQTTTALDGSISVRHVELPEIVSVADVGLALLIAAIVVIAVRNAPGVMEIAVPRRLPLDAGARYAIATITQYSIILLGLVVACSVLGLTWSKVQWLVAAVSVGLGFGLQEIFANFVSGLILLFERPIRVGDIVTIDNITGLVSRIQIRATTVINWDRQEFIVPNKDFVTGRLLNWTRTDTVNRIVITVGVAYGSDTDHARELLLSSASEHPEVMADPAPIVTFEQFNESTLDLVLRCFLGRLDNRLQTIHDLHTAIHKRFNEAGIEIAFPQRDIHIRSGWLPPQQASEPIDPSPHQPAV